jgi:hypothetical protein
MSDTTTQAPTAAEVAEIIVELEKYRDRLVNETMEAGKKAKLSKTAVMAQLEGDLVEVDQRLAQARALQAQLGAAS